jgi:hypothetical protein
MGGRPGKTLKARAAAHPYGRRMTPRRIALVPAVLLGAYLVVRAVVELFAVDYSDPSSYARDWGGPSLAGVLLVHCGPGVLAAALAGAYLLRRRRATRPPA